MVGAHILNIVRCDLWFVPFVFLGHPLRHTLQILRNTLIRWSPKHISFLGALKSPWTTGATYIKLYGYWLASMQKICMPHICFQKRWLLSSEIRRRIH